MAIAKDSRSAGKKRPPAGGNLIRTHPTAPRQPEPSPARNGSSPPKAPGDLLDELIYLRARLKTAYAVSITVDLALRNQNCDRDTEIADTVRWSISDWLASDMERVERQLSRISDKASEQRR
jgi:hypothetical protein